MENLARVIAAYKAMDQRRKDENLRLLELDAKKHLEKQRVSLKLVANNKGK
ncbi:hypothetical protein DUPY_04750 [Duganella phyllosphaerae]|uniref:Uncharacterized protein n=1 Tax=Duganella phyllosphaerae TaxID=762836 RepID=A0A1E7X6T2_9BURK|nr:hypothetical protein DUPY_04750 [Duganella phyllosphaerae]